MDAQQEQSAPGAYLAFVERQLTADGCTTRWEDWAGVSVLVGRRAEFRMRWMATRLHLFTVAAAVPEITVPVVSDFTDHVMRYAKDTKGGLPVGMQTGIGAFPLLVSDRVDPAAVQWAEAQQRVRFACMTRPVVVDSSRRYVGMYRGKPVLGRVYASYFNEKGALYFHGQ
ncbi:levansucrase [Streptomyces adustus]|uniref:Levansucrase n=1 Tax=Streptomyces adustus TaxID=1609272 RepID=A0A5N8VQ27_9ACTN|nr:levansucrase [Streptomyces adustus]MPY36168.1 levansucrase [Streptomyces adustus]